MTILSAAKTRDSPEPTFPIAIGYKSDDHNDIERIIGDDFKTMRSTRTHCFLGATKGRLVAEVTFLAEMYLSLGDQPERQGGNGLNSGKARSHGRWRFACDHLLLRDQIPACSTCYELMRRYDSIDNTELNGWRRECTMCSNWMLRGMNDPILKYQPKEGFINRYLFRW
jgi:hypothetical protein